MTVNMDDFKPKTTDQSNVVTEAKQSITAEPDLGSEQILPEGVIFQVSKGNHTASVIDNSAENTKYKFKAICTCIQWQGIYREEHVAINSAKYHVEMRYKSEEANK